MNLLLIYFGIGLLLSVIQIVFFHFKKTRDRIFFFIAWLLIWPIILFIAMILGMEYFSELTNKHK